MPAAAGSGEVGSEAAGSRQDDEGVAAQAESGVAARGSVGMARALRCRPAREEGECVEVAADARLREGGEGLAAGSKGSRLQASAVRTERLQRNE